MIGLKQTFHFTGYIIATVLGIATTIMSLSKILERSLYPCDTATNSAGCSVD